MIRLLKKKKKTLSIRRQSKYLASFFSALQTQIQLIQHSRSRLLENSTLKSKTWLRSQVKNKEAMENRTLVKMGDPLFICYQTGTVAWKELRESRRKKVGLLSEHPASFSATLLFQKYIFSPTAVAFAV